MPDTVEQAIYALRYQTGDSEKNLRAVRQEATALTRDTDKLSASEENLNRSTLRFLGTLDKKHASQLKQADQLDRVHRLYIEGAISSERYARAVGQITSTTSQGAGALSAMTGAVNVLKSALGALGFAFGAIQVVQFARDSIRMAADLDDVAQTIGVTTDELQAYRAAALDAGASSSIADEAIRKYTRSVGEAQGGNKQIIQAFKDLGLTAADLAGGPSASLPIVVEALNRIESVTERARLETDLFGRSGQNIEQVLRAWGGAANELVEKYRAMGVIISPETIERIDQATAKWDLFWQRMRTGVVEFFDALTSPQAAAANEQLLALGIGNVGQIAPKAPPDISKLPFMGSDSKRIVAAGTAKWADEEKAAIEAADKALKEHAKDVAAFEKDYRVTMARVAKELSDKFEKDRAAAAQWASDMYVAGKKVRDDAANFARERAEAEKKAWDDSFDAYYKLQDELILEQQKNHEKAVKESSRTLRDGWGSALDSMYSDWGGFLSKLLGAGASTVMELLRMFKGALGGLGGGRGGAGSGFLSGLGGLGGLWGGAARIDPSTGNWIPGPQGFGGGGLLGQLGGIGGVLGNGLMGAGVGSMVGSLTGGRSTGSTIGGAIGAIAGNLIPIPVLGPLIGAALGGAIGGMFGGKPSDMRSVATFGSDYSFAVKAQSAHESSQETLSSAQQAAALIGQQVQELMAVGVTFTQQLGDIMIGARDVSTFRLAGSSKRIGVGSVGDPADLAADVIAALMKTATSTDPAIAAILKGTGTPQEIAQQIATFQAKAAAAKQFSSEIETALLSVQDPLKAAIEMWKKEAQARLDAAATLGVDVAKVQQLNTLLYQQIQQQMNAQSIAGLQGFVSSYAFGSQSMATPAQQVAAAGTAYDLARQAALADPNQANVQAFLQSSQAYLPLAKSHYGISSQYAAIEQGALSTADQLLASLKAVPSAPDLQPVVSAVSSGAAMTTAAAEETTAEVASLKQEIIGLNNKIIDLLGHVTGGAPA